MHNIYIYIYIQEMFQMKDAKQDEFVTNHLVFAESLKEHHLNMHIGKTSVHSLRTICTIHTYLQTIAKTPPQRGQCTFHCHYMSMVQGVQNKCFEIDLSFLK